MAVINNISVWWHVAGAAAVILILWLIPEQHARFSDVFAKTINNSGMFGGRPRASASCSSCLPIAAILTQYTITGYDASAHLSEETKSAADGAAKGIWRSIFYSAIGGWILLLTFLFAVQDSDEVSAAGGAVVTIFNQAMDSKWVAIVLLISTAGQFFCTTACQTSASRMLFAFSRDRAVPGHQLWSALSSKNGFPPTASWSPRFSPRSSPCPRLSRSTSTARPSRSRSSRSSRSVWSGCTCVSPCRSIFAGGWVTHSRSADGTCAATTSGWHPSRSVEIIITSIIAMFPTSLGGMPWDPSFEWKFVNYTPLFVGGVLILLYIYWHVSVKNWFTGPIKQVDETGESWKAFRNADSTDCPSHAGLSTTR